jgi:hypothetical protein
MFCALDFAADILAGLVARVKKLRTKLMMGELGGSSIERKKERVCSNSAVVGRCDE